MNYQEEQRIDEKLANTVVQLPEPLTQASVDAYTAVQTQENGVETMSAHLARDHGLAVLSSTNKFHSPMQPRSTTSNASSSFS